VRTKQNKNVSKAENLNKCAEKWQKSLYFCDNGSIIMDIIYKTGESGKGREHDRKNADLG